MDRYVRPRYGDPNAVKKTCVLPYSTIRVDVPTFETPVTPVENFRLAAARKTPYWIPNHLTDYQQTMVQNIVIGDVGFAPDLYAAHEDGERMVDCFGCDWIWVASAGGPMLTPGTHVVEDITEWEKDVKWPNLSDWDWQTKADQFMKNEYDPNKVLHINLFQGATERLIALLGGYTEGMLALAMEPEAVLDYMNAFAEYFIGLFDHVRSLYPVDMITYHDDWGTEKDTFFGNGMMEELIFEPTKRIVDHVKEAGCVFELHSCGNVTRFIPYMIDMGVDFLQLQRRAVDLPAMKKKYGDKIGFNTGLEGLAPGTPLSGEELLQHVRDSVDLYGAHGGFYPMLFESDPKKAWEISGELYTYSRAYYDRERETG